MPQLPIPLATHEDKLPAPARAKLERLRSKAGELHAAVQAAQDEKNELARERADAERRVHELTDPVGALRAGMRPVADDHPSAMQAAARRDRAAASLEQAGDRLEARQARWTEAGAVASNVERWLASLSPTAAIAPYDGAPPKLGKHESAAAAVERTRRLIAELHSGLHRVRSAPLLSATVKQRIKAEIDALAEKGRPDVWLTVESGERLQWPTMQIASKVVGVAVAKDGPLTLDGHAHASVPNTLALLAWLHKDALIAALNQEVDALADDGAALSDEERAKQEATLLDSILAVERDEEMFIELAEQELTEIPRRRDADPRAVLGVVLS